MSEPASSNVPRYVSVMASSYAFIAGLLSLIGWSTGLYRLTDWTGSGITIKANTSLTAMVAAFGLIVAVLAPRARLLVRVPGACVAAIGALMLFQHISGWNLGIDTLLFEEPSGAPATAAPGRMGPPAALSFLAIGSALLLMTFSAPARSVSAALGIAVLAIGALSLTGHWYGAKVLYTLPRVSGVALQTATIITALAIALLTAVADRQPVRTLCEDSSVGMLARRLVPLIFIVPLVLGWFRIQGEQLGFYDLAFGTAIRSIIEVLTFAALFWWSLRAIRTREVAQRRAEKELRDSERRATQMLERITEADRRKDEFLATLAHELRNPLAPVRNAAKVLSTKGVPESSLQWGADVITRQVQHMARLLEDLLDVSRISRNRLELRKEWIELSMVIQNAVEASHPAIESARHELTITLPSEPVYVDGDPVRLAQVFSNLLNNAAKYTEPGGRIEVHAEAAANEVTVRVKDTGLGIDAATLPRVFEMFAQAKPALQRSAGGLGIGLSLAKGIVELHQGEIEAHSEGAGKGSEFIVRLPRMAVRELTPRVAANDPMSTTARRVLVVDDLKDSADSLALLLRSLGHDVQTAYDGEAAIEAAARFRPQAIFLDLGMPGLNGFEVCQRIRKASWSTGMFIVALTGWGQPEDRRRTKEAGFDEHLIKPADTNALIVLLNSLPLEVADAG